MDKKTGLIFINREGLIKGLAATLKNLEKGEVTHVVGGSTLNDGVTTSRTDDIYIDEKKVFHTEHFESSEYFGCYPSKEMITIASAFDLVEPLYKNYPYLEIIMNRVAMDMFLSDGNDITERMVDAAVWYESYMPYTEQILSFTKTRNN